MSTCLCVLGCLFLSLSLFSISFSGHSTQAEESIDEEPQDEVEAVRLKTIKVRELRSEIDQLRNFISDQYAEEVGSNCITQ